MIIREVFCEAFVEIVWEAKHQDTFRSLVCAFMDLIGSKRDRLITVSFISILRLREVDRMTARIVLEFAPEFVYIGIQAYGYRELESIMIQLLSVAFATGCKRIKIASGVTARFEFLLPCGRVESKRRDFEGSLMDKRLREG
ncbi:hypothetical protein Tco_0526413 [Tanacetum coccineum]